MPNQYTNTYREDNCKCNQCGKLFHKRPSEAAKDQKHFCSKECYLKGNLKYDAADIQYVIDNIKTIGYAGIQEHFGITRDALAKMISIWKKNGHAIPPLKVVYKLGDEVVREDKGKMIKFVKTERGWRRASAIGKNPIPKTKKKVAKKTSQPQVIPIPKKPVVILPKRKETILADRKIDESQLTSVRLNSKTYVLFNKNKDVNKVKEVYANIV